MHGYKSPGRRRGERAALSGQAGVRDAESLGKNMDSRIDSRKFKGSTRRELLKLAPVLAVGAFAIPKLQEPLLKAGLGFSDWASARLFRSGHVATTFADPN